MNFYVILANLRALNYAVSKIKLLTLHRHIHLHRHKNGESYAMQTHPNKDKIVQV